MSDNFIPIVSNTPPPIDDFVYDDDFQEDGVVNNQWGDVDDFGEFTDHPPILHDTPPKEKDSLSFITCASRFESPQIAHHQKIENSIENLDISSNHLDLSTSEDFFSATDLHISPQNETPQNVPRINRSPSPSSLDGIKFVVSDASQQNLKTELASKNGDPTDEDKNKQLDVKDDLSSKSQISDNPAENGHERASLKTVSNNLDTDSDVSSYVTTHTTIPDQQETISNSDDLSKKDEESINEKPMDLLEPKNDHNDSVSSSSVEFYSVSDFGKYQDLPASENQTMQPPDLPNSNERSQFDSGFHADKVEQYKQETDDFADFAGFDKDVEPGSQNYDDFADFSSNTNHHENNFANFQEKSDTYADFQCNSIENDGNFTKFDDNANEFDDFAKFDDELPADGDDFGDFDTAQFSTMPTQPTFTQSSVSFHCRI